MIAAFCNTAALVGVGTVLGLHVYDLTARELDLGLVGLFQFAPSLVLLFITGAVADVVDRGSLLAWGSLGQAAAATALAWFALADSQEVTTVFVLVTLFGASRAFATAAVHPLVADVVSVGDLPWVVSRRSLVTRAAGVAGPVIAGPAYASSAELAYALIAVLLTTCAGAAALVSRATRANRHSSDARRLTSLDDALEGVRFVRQTPALLGAISLDLWAVLFGGAVALLPALAQEQLEVGPSAVGLLRAAGSVGAGLTAVLLAWRPLMRHVGPILICSVTVFGLATIWLGTTTSLRAAIVAMFVLSSADGISVFIRHTLVPVVTPNTKLGRVWALSTVTIGASNELGALESGAAAELIGPSRAVAAGGVATIAIAAAYGRWARSLRDLDDFQGAATR
jgi:hypothetical protein